MLPEAGIADRYLTAIEIYVLICIIFIFLGLVQYGILLMMEDRNRRRRREGGLRGETKMDARKKMAEKSPPENKSRETDDDKRSEEKEKENVEGGGRNKKKKFTSLSASRIDRVALIAFPTLFLLFNIVFFSVYKT